jgi:hypothetical protein
VKDPVTRQPFFGYSPVIFYHSIIYEPVLIEGKQTMAEYGIGIDSPHRAENQACDCIRITKKKTPSPVPETGLYDPLICSPF